MSEPASPLSSGTSRHAGWVLRLGLITSAWVVVITGFTVQLAGVDGITWQNALYFSLLDWGPWIVLSPVVLWFAARVQIDAKNWRRTVPLHLLAGIVIGLTLEFVSMWVFEAGWMPVPERSFRLRLRPPDGSEPGRTLEFRPDPRGGPSFDSRPAPLPGSRAEGRSFGRGPRPGGPGRLIRFRLAFPVYLVLVAVAHAFSYYRRSVERERRALLAESMLGQARLNALQNQLHPHFLFNTLNSISSLIFTSPKAADEMLCALSELLRSVLEVADRAEQPLEDELQFTQRYLAIQQLRFADRLRVEYKIAADVRRVLVPTLVLQPLVENAVVHGVAFRMEPGVVTISARSDGGRLHVEITDTGTGGLSGTKAEDGSLRFEEGLGLGNTRARLSTLYGTDFHFQLTPASAGGVRVLLDLPLRHAGPEPDRS
ncbi:MAG: histidine kinase [Opitutaceae bacterium]|nr:histidine kinase [Opitutaceae bacterium]